MGNGRGADFQRILTGNFYAQLHIFFGSLSLVLLFQPPELRLPSCRELWLLLKTREQIRTALGNALDNMLMRN